MIWNNLPSKWFGSLCFVLLVAGSPALAQTQVDVKVSVKGDTLYIDAHTSAPQPQLRMNPDPAFLELTFPKSALAGQPASTAVDKGLIQRVVTSANAQDAVIRVHVLSKPKTSLTKTGTGYRYAVKLSEMAHVPSRTPEAAQPTAAQPKAAQPTATQPAQPAATQPEPPKPATAAQPATTQPTTAQPESTPARTVAAPPATTAKLVKEYFPFKSRSAEKAMKAAQLAFPNATYVVDPILNILMVEGTAQDIEELEKFLRAQSPK
ncbi:MAG: hypothetical protein WC314_02720 [Vulcanimicrobiota bacterium]